MPSPVGHALGGFAFGWLAVRSSRLSKPLLAGVTFATLGAIPDVDILVEGTHRLYTHSIAAVAFVAVLAAVSLRAIGTAGDERWRLVVAATLAYGSHLLLDWLGDDRSVPYGIRALWPFSDTYFQSDLRLFPQVERQYWLPGFLTANVRAVTHELLMLAPLVAFAIWLRMRRAQA